MSVTAVDSNLAPGGASPDAKFTDALITQAVTIGGQFIIMPKAQEMLNDAMSDDDEE